MRMSGLGLRVNTAFRPRLCRAGIVWSVRLLYCLLLLLLLPLLPLLLTATTAAAAATATAEDIATATATPTSTTTATTTTMATTTCKELQWERSAETLPETSLYHARNNLQF